MLVTNELCSSWELRREEGRLQIDVWTTYYYLTYHYNKQFVSIHFMDHTNPVRILFFVRYVYGTVPERLLPKVEVATLLIDRLFPRSFSYTVLDWLGTPLDLGCRIHNNDHQLLLLYHVC